MYIGTITSRLGSKVMVTVVRFGVQRRPTAAMIVRFLMSRCALARRGARRGKGLHRQRRSPARVGVYRAVGLISILDRGHFFCFTTADRRLHYTA